MALESDEEIIGAFLEFFKNYTNFDGEYVYLDRINAMIKDGERSIAINFDDLELMDTTHELDLTSTLLEYPEHALAMACDALTEQVKEENFPYYQEIKVNSQKFTARFANVPTKINIREIRSNHVNQIKWIEGIVIRASQIKPIITQAHFICKLNPDHQGTIPQFDGHYRPPTTCFEPTCKSKEFILVMEESILIDWQAITVQESPDKLPPGVSPKSISCQLLDDLVDAARPGDRVKLGGIVRTRADKPVRKGQTLRFDLWIDTNYVETFDKETDLSEITAEEEAEFQEIADDPQLYHNVISSIAPQIKGMEREKEAIMLFLFAGVDKIFPNGFKTRGQPHVLFLGDPGVAKCVTGDTEVLLANGTTTPIAEIVECELQNNKTTISDGYYARGNLGIFTLSSNGRITPSHANIFWKRLAPEYLYHITTQSGKSIRVSPTHPFFLTANGMIYTKKSQNLTMNDCIAIPRLLPLQNDSSKSANTVRDAINPLQGFEQLQNSTDTSSNKRKQLDKSSSLNSISDLSLNQNQLLNAIRTTQLLSQSNMRITKLRYQQYGQDSSKISLDRILAHLETSKPNSEAFQLQKLSTTDIYWDKIATIEKVKSTEKWVYDLQVPKTHNYVANNIFVHNSQLLKSAKAIAPRGVYTSGKGSSAAGLTAAIARDPDTNEITLEAGAMVLADRGVCLIDEFDKMDEKDRSAIHEAMEQNTISIAKAGIVATLNARTGVLAAANPKNGRYEDRRPFRENINLSEPILSRFDIIFILRDIADEKSDADKADHILSLHLNHSTATTDTPPISIATLRKYIAYAKQKSQPALTREATNIIQDFYVNMRTSNNGTENKITITARQLEGIIRLAEAHARVALRTKVSKEDADKAIELVTYSLNQIAIDPETGELDYDAFASGITTKKRNKLSVLLEITERLSNEKMGGAFTDAEFFQMAELEGVDIEFVKKTLPELVRSGTLYRPQKGSLKRS